MRIIYENISTDYGPYGTQNEYPSAPQLDWLGGRAPLGL